MPNREWLRLPVVSTGAEHLVMGYLMRRNILTYKAPPNNEGYDLICIHPNPRHRPAKNEAGFELIAQRLGIPRPTKVRAISASDPNLES